MKQLNITLAFALINIAVLVAQSPNGINYQGVGRSLDGAPISNHEISLKLSILDGSTEGEVLYSEIHEIRTNRFGLFTLIIGDGGIAPPSNGLAFIDWSSGKKWLQVELDENGGRNFRLMGTMQFMSVPYALYAERSGSTYQAGLGIDITDNVISNVGDNNVMNELITNIALTSDNRLQVTEASTTTEVDLSSLAAPPQDLQSVLVTGNNAGGLRIENLGLPTTASDATTKQYVDDLDALDGDKSPTNEIQTLTQVLTEGNDAGGVKLSNLGTPTNGLDATTKNYVDQADNALSGRIANHYGFKVSYNHTHTAPITQVVTIVSEDFDDFGVIVGNQFVTPEDGTYQFTVSGISPIGGIPMQIRINRLSGPAELIEVKRQIGFPSASIPNYVDGTIVKLNVGETVELVVSSILTNEIVTGTFFGNKL
ncbi:MAG TPA: hypothetical protein PKJ63_01475 [Cyclobacteriaceae bacterium]|nr:hypothetical protein [Cyclobacteriaceae bacterium]